MASAEGVKDAAEAYCYGYPQRGGRDGMTVVAASTGEFSILGRVQGGRKGNNFAAWEEPELSPRRSERRSGRFGR